MTPPFLATVLRAGRLPASVQAEIAAEVVLFRAESIWVAGSGSFHSPGRVQAAGVRMHFGGFAVTSTRIVASVGKAKVADAPFSVDSPGAAATLRLGRDGLHFTIDVARAIPSGTGSMDIHFRAPITDTQLAGLPALSISLAPSADGATQLLRWI